jgi:hypothetical protein
MVSSLLSGKLRTTLADPPFARTPATYQSSADFKRTVLAHLTWDILARRVFYGTVQLTALARLILYRGVSTSFSLIASPVPSVAEVALGILRNITCVTNNEAITGLRDDEMGEKRLLDLLEDRIAEGAAVGGPGNGSSGAGAPAAERNAVEVSFSLSYSRLEGVQFPADALSLDTRLSTA